MEPETIADLINYGLIILLIISFLYVLVDRFCPDQTLYDWMQHPSPATGQPITYHIEPCSPGDAIPFPSVFDPAEVYVSFIIPAYNEEQRIPAMLEETFAYLNERKVNDPSFTFEVIVVDDGSKDKTADVVLGFARQHPEVRLLRQPFNMGKGAAVQAGCLCCRGTMMLMVDADGATKISEFELLETKMCEALKHQKKVVVVGSRAHLDGNQKANRTAIRDFLGNAFHLLICLSGVNGIKDTQCGFKLFSRDAARWLFPNQHIQRWCFDPELLVIAAKKNMKVAEIPVEWNEIEGSKMNIKGMVNMALDLVKIAVFHRTGIWSVRMKGVPRDDL